MWSIDIFGFPLFELYLYFLIYSFLGWLMESVFVSAHQGRWVNRGFLRGPVCPIYGVGAVGIIILLTPALDSLPMLFLGGFLIATADEYAVGAVLEKLFHTRWWDYSEKPFHLRGYVCLERSLEWGALSVFFMRVLQPRMAAFAAAVPRVWGELAGTLIFAYMAVDGTITVLHILRLNEKLRTLSRNHEKLREKLESTRLYGLRKDLLAHFEAMTMAEALEDLKGRMEQNEEKWDDMRLESRLRREYLLNEVFERMEKRLRLLQKSTATERRLLRIYPGMRSKQFDEELQAIKRELEQMKTKKNGKDALQ